jgi:hypothetical protein
MDHCIDGSHLITKRNAKHQFRQHIFQAWNNKCAYCLTVADTLDHVRPRHKGGATVVSNLVPACQDCNRRKGSEHWRKWYQEQDYWLIDQELQIAHWLASGDKKP